MASILDLIQGDMGQQIAQGMSSETNQSEEKTSQVISMALPILMGAMKRNAATPDGAAGLLGALNNKHDGSILNDLGGLFSGGVNEEVRQDGAGILGHVLGGSQNNVANALSQRSGMDSGSVMRILQTIAPIVLGFLGKQQRSRNVQSQSGMEGLLGGLMGGGRKQQRKQQSLIEGLLDGDNDGSVLDDVAGMVISGGKKKGGLGGLLGGLFGR